MRRSKQEPEQEDEDEDEEEWSRLRNANCGGMNWPVLVTKLSKGELACLSPGLIMMATPGDP